MRLDAIAIGSNPPDEVNVVDRSAGGRRAGQVRDGQGGRHHGGRPLPLYVHALSRQLRFYPPHPVGGRRSGGRSGGQRARYYPRRRDGGEADRRLQDDRREGGRRKDRGGAVIGHLAALRERARPHRLARDHPPADRALLCPLQGSRRRQVGEGGGLGRCRRGAQAHHGSDRAGQEAPPRFPAWRCHAWRRRHVRCCAAGRRWSSARRRPAPA